MPGRTVTFARPKFVVTPALVAINVLVFLMMVTHGVSFTSPNIYQLVQWGADYGPYTFGHQQMWRLLTSNYLHIGIVHLLVNMWCLWGLGRLAEVFYGSADFALAYVLSGVSGSILSIMLKPLGVSAGASGAIFGIAGLMLTTLKWGNVPLPPENKNAIYKGVLQFAGINLFFGAVAPGVDNLAHMGGFVSGLLVGAVMGKHLDESPESTAYRRKAWLWFALLLVVVLYVLAHTRWVVRVPSPPVRKP
jgi:membrane associated rhomboid family serine protease